METIKEALRESYKKYTKEELVEILVDISQIYVLARVFSNLCGSNVMQMGKNGIADGVAREINDICFKNEYGIEKQNVQDKQASPLGT